MLKKNTFFFLKKNCFRSYFTFNTKKTALLIFVFLLYFLFFFRPFGLYNLSELASLLIAIGYSLMAVLGYCFSVFLFRPSDDTRWTKSHEFLAYTSYLGITWLLIFMYSVCFYEILYPKWLVEEEPINIKDDFCHISFIDILITGYIIYILLQLCNVFYSYIKTDKNNINSNNSNKDSNIISNPIVVLKGRNKKEEVSFSMQSFICLVGDGHYLNIFYLCETSNKIKNLRLRNSIKAIELQTSKFPFIYRCHNSFIINLRYLKNVRGNLHQAYAYIMHYPEKIPISKNKINFLRNTIKIKNESGFN